MTNWGRSTSRSHSIVERRRMGGCCFFSNSEERERKKKLTKIPENSRYQITIAVIVAWKGIQNKEFRTQNSRLKNRGHRRSKSGSQPRLARNLFFIPPPPRSQSALSIFISSYLRYLRAPRSFAYLISIRSFAWLSTSGRARFQFQSSSRARSTEVSTEKKKMKMKRRRRSARSEVKNKCLLT